MKNKLIFSLFLTLALMSGSIGTPIASGQNFSASVSPRVIKIEAVAPSLVRAPISFENSSDQTITYSIFLRPFKAGAVFNGEPDFDPELSSEYEDFFKNVAITDQGKTISEITLSPNQRKDLMLLIQVSEQMKENDYYFSAIFLSQANEIDTQKNNTVNRGGIGTNILLTIGPKENPAGAISNFSMPRFFSKGPVEFELEIANLNDYYVATEGNVIIKNMFGQAVGNIEIMPTNILANSNRIISDSGNKLIWNEKFLFGIYKADLNIAISDKGPLLHESRYFFALPVKEFLVAAAIFMALLWLFRAARRKNMKE